MSSLGTRARRVAAGASATCVGGILILAPSAAGQSAVDQYVPQLDKGGAASEATATPGAGAASPGSDDAGGPKSGASPVAEEAIAEGESGGGSAGGFPLTPFVAVLGAAVLLLLAARLIRPLLSRLESIRLR